LSACQKSLDPTNKLLVHEEESYKKTETFF
jgi:hypothetical protein